MALEFHNIIYNCFHCFFGVNKPKNLVHFYMLFNTYLYIPKDDPPQNGLSLTCNVLLIGTLLLASKQLISHQLRLTKIHFNILPLILDM